MTPSATKDIASPPVAPTPLGRGLSAWEWVSLSAAHLVVSGMLAVFSLRGLYHFGRMFGTVEYLLDFKRRRRFREALGTILERKPTGPERRKWTHRFFVDSRCDKLFYLILDRLPREQAAQLLTIENEPLLRDCVNRGHGVFFGLSHVGSQHIGGVLLTQKGYKVTGVRDRNQSGMRRYVQDRLDRRHAGTEPVRMLFADSFPRETIRCYRDGCIVGSAIDIHRIRGEHQRVEYAEMFGEKRPFLTGPLRIALRCRAPVLHGFVTHDSHFRYRFELAGMLIDPETVEDEEAAVTQAVRTYARHLQDRLKSRPSLVTRI